MGWLKSRPRQQMPSRQQYELEGWLITCRDTLTVEEAERLKLLLDTMIGPLAALRTYNVEVRPI